MFYRLIPIALLAYAATSASAVEVPGKSSLTVSAGTLGIGLEFAHTLPIVNLTGRIAWNGFSYDYADSIDGTDYDFELGLRNVTALVDWRPWGNFTHFTAGVVFNGNTIDLKNQPAASYMIGGSTYSSDEVGSLSGNVSFDEIVPYLGLGWNLPVAPRTAVSLELGVVLQGEPQLSLEADGLLASDPTFQAEMERERAEAQEDISAFKYYPVISLGLQRRF